MYLIKIDPKNKAFNYSWAASFYMQSGNNDKALEAYNQAIRFGANTAQDYKNRGILFTMKKEYKEALIDFNKSIEISNNYIDAYKGRESLYRQMATETNDTKLKQEYLEKADKDHEVILNTK
jgi:tetratricopeptide (TPR) repeat protein